MTKLGVLTIQKPSPPETYLGVANSMIKGVMLMAKGRSDGLALSLVAAHTLECVLKAYLSRNGDDRRLREKELRHDLKKLWELAQKEGLPINDIPNWAINLSKIHITPYYLRYSTGIHGIVTPASEPMATELRKLIQTAEKGIVNYRNSHAE